MRQPRALPRARAEAGFTLMELIAGLAIGLVVSFATFAIIETTVHGQRRIADRVDAAQRGRTAVERLILELHSGCVSPSVSPILASANGVNSDAWNVVFVSGMGSGATLNPVEHVLSLSGGTLLDTSYPQLTKVPALAPTDWRFSATASGQHVLLTNIAAQYSPVGGTRIFQYYGYQNPANPQANSLQNAAAMTTPLVATNGAANQDATVAMVTIALRVGPTSGSTVADRSQTLSDGVVLRLSPASEGSDTVNVPCV